MAAATNHSHQARQGRPRSAAICRALSWRCGLPRVRRLRPAVLRVDGEDHARALAEHGLVADHVDARLPHVVAVHAARVDDGEAVRPPGPAAGSGRRPPPPPGPTARSARAATAIRPRPTSAPSQALRVREMTSGPATRRGTTSSGERRARGRRPARVRARAPCTRRGRGQAGHEEALRLDREQVGGLQRGRARRARRRAAPARARSRRRGAGQRRRGGTRAARPRARGPPSPGPTPSCSGRGSCAGGW